MRRPASLDVLCGLVVAGLYAGTALLRAHFRLLNSVEVESYWRGVQGLVWDNTHGTPTEIFFPLNSLMAVLVRIATLCFGAGPLAIRFSALLAGAVAVTLLWLGLRARLGTLAASVGCMAFLATPASAWADFAGPQPLLLLCVTSAAFCFLSSQQTLGRRRLTQLAGVMFLFPVLGGFAGTFWVLGGVALAIGSAILITRLPAFGSGLSLAVSTFVVLCIAAFGARDLQRQRHAYQSFLHSIERATAPGEEVQVDNSDTALPLEWYASPTMRQQIHWNTYGRYAPHHFAIQPFMAQERAEYGPSHELVVIGVKEKGLTWHWVEAGYALIPLEATPDLQLLWAGRTPMMREQTRVFLVAPSANAMRPQNGKIKP